MSDEFRKLPPRRDAKPGMRIAGTSLTTTSEAYIKNGKSHIDVLCDCGATRRIHYHNLGRVTRSCGRGCNKKTPEQIALAAVAEKLRATADPRKSNKRPEDCSAEERAAHLAYIEQTRRVSDVEERARALAGTAAPRLYVGPVSCASAEQLAAHWAYLDDRLRKFQKPTTIEQGVVYGFWLSLESHQKPLSRTKILCRCVLCNKTERPVLFRGLQLAINGGCRCSRPPVNRPTLVKPGDRFGKWTVLELVGDSTKISARVQCECGSEPRIIQVQGMQVGYSQSCGCHNLETRRNKLPVGFRRGRLTVLRWLRQSIRGNGRPGDSVYLCQCDCGNEKEVLSRHLNTGPDSNQKGTLSCGCLAIESISKIGTRMVTDGRIANARWLYLGKQGAKLMRSTWELAVAEKLDAIDAPWIYEGKTFKLKEGMRYTPDFFLPAKNKWLEVKAIVRDPHFAEKIALFRQTIGKVFVMWEMEVERFVKMACRQIYRQYAAHEITDKAARAEIRQLIKRDAGPDAFVGFISGNASPSQVNAGSGPQ